jgi:hypothetical protein
VNTRCRGPVHFYDRGSHATALPILAFAICLAAGAGAQDTGRNVWLNGDALQRRLDAHVGIAWSSEPLRQKLNKLSEHESVAIWLDRRIDPSQEPAWNLPEMPLRDLFDAIAARLEAGTCLIGPLVYLGPRETASRLATVAALRHQEASRLPPAVQSRLARTAAWKWEALSTPRDLLEELAREVGVGIEDVRDIPHDLWPAVNLPPLTFCERLTLLLAGFDRTFEFIEGGTRVRIVPLPPQPVLVVNYAAGSDIADAIARLQQLVPQAQLRREGARIRVAGRAEDHDAIRKLLDLNRNPAKSARGSRNPASGAPRTVYTMRGPTQLGTALKTLQVQAQVNVHVDPRVQHKLYERIMFEATNVSLEELIAIVLKDTGLKFELNNRELRVLPGDG